MIHRAISSINVLWLIHVNFLWHARLPKTSSSLRDFVRLLKQRLRDAAGCSTGLTTVVSCKRGLTESRDDHAPCSVNLLATTTFSVDDRSSLTTSTAEDDLVGVQTCTRDDCIAATTTTRDAR